MNTPYRYICSMLPTRSQACTAPNRHWRSFSGVRVCRVAFELLIKLESFYLCFLGAHAKIRNSMTSLSRIYLKLANFPVKKGLNEGIGGSPKKFQIEIFIFMLLGSPRKDLEPYDKPFWNIFENSPFSGQNRVNWGG